VNKLTTRWLIRRDIEAAVEVGAMVAWDATDLNSHHRGRNSISMVCEADKNIVGHVAYSLNTHSIHIVNIAAEDWDSEWWVTTSELQPGPAYQMVQRILNGMVNSRRDLITVDVPDDQDDILCFFRDCGFLVWQQSEGLIHMRYTLPIETELTSIDGIVCRRSSGLPCMRPQECR